MKITKKLAEGVLAIGLALNPSPLTAQTRVVSPNEIDDPPAATQVENQPSHSRAATVDALKEKHPKTNPHKLDILYQDSGSVGRNGVENHTEDLYMAIHNNLPPAAIIYLMKTGANANTEFKATYGPENKSALDYAVSEGQINNVKAMLQNGARLENPERLSKNAMKSGSVAMIKFLLQKGVEVNLNDPEFWRGPNAIASVENAAEAVKLGIPLGRDGNFSGMYYVLEGAMHARPSGDKSKQKTALAVVDYLLKHGGDVNSAGGWSKEILLTEVVKAQDDPELAETLLKNGANVNAKSPEGRTVLMDLVSSQFNKNKTEFVKLLLKYGADPNAVSSTGSTALHYNTNHMVYDNRAHDKNGYVGTWVPTNDGEEVASLLVKNGAHVNAQDFNGRTPLMAQVDPNYLGDRDPSLDYAKHLISLGADSNIKDKTGQTFVDLTRALYQKQTHFRFPASGPGSIETKKAAYNLLQEMGANPGKYRIDSSDRDPRKDDNLKLGLLVGSLAAVDAFGFVALSRQKRKEQISKQSQSQGWSL